jgi:hypothetical protein
MLSKIENQLDKLILLIGLALRLVGLSHGAPWHDEAFTGLVSPLPWDRFWEALIGDVHPPLWYLIERVSMALLGRNEVALRLPAALCSAAALYLFWRHFCRDAATAPLPGTARLAALAMMALSPFQIYYAQEGRMYATLTLCIVMMMIGVVQLRPHYFFGGALVAVWLHNLGSIYVLAGLLGLLAHWVRNRSDLAKITLVSCLDGATALVFALPAVFWTGYQLLHVNSGYWILDKSLGSWLYNSFFCPLVGQGVIDSRLSWHAATLALTLVLGGTLIAVRERRWWLLAFALLPGLIMLAVSNLLRPLLLARTLIGASPAIYLLAGQLFTTRRRQIALGICLLPLFVSGLHNHYILDRRGGVAPLVRWIEIEQPNAVIHSQTGAWILMAWHMPEWDHYLWEGAYHGLGNAISDQTAHALGMERVGLDDLPRPVGVVYADYALVSPYERETMLDELAAAGAELAYTLAEDEVSRVDLWMLR